MGDEDDIERLLREVAALEGGQPTGKPPAVPPGKAVDTGGGKESTGGSRGSWVVVNAVGGAIAGFVIGTLLFFLPWVDGISTALGAALGAALAALIGGPPGWFNR